MAPLTTTLLLDLWELEVIVTITLVFFVPLSRGEDGSRQIGEGAADLSTTQRLAAHTHTHT